MSTKPKRSLRTPPAIPGSTPLPTLPTPTLAPVHVHQVEEGKPVDDEEISAEHFKKWAETRSLLVWSAPGFRHLFFTMMAKSEAKNVAVMTRKVPIAATDGDNIMVNPDRFFLYGPLERLFIAAHEVSHGFLDDIRLLHLCRGTGFVPMTDGTRLPYDETTLQHAMDYRINAMLVESNIGRLPDTTPGMPPGMGGGLYDKDIATGMDSVLDVYKKIYDPNKKRSGGFDVILQPGASQGKSANQAAAARNPQAWQVAVNTASIMELSKSQGKGIGTLQRIFENMLTPEVPWTDHIHGIFNRKVGSGSYNWRKPDRRFIMRDLHMPSRSGNGAGWVLCWGDVSGSMTPRETESSLGELSGILQDCKPRRLTVIWGDDAIQQVDELTDPQDIEAIRFRGVKGGGGTSMEYVLDWIKENGEEPPEVLVCFTDGEVDYPPEPPFHVIWASTQDKKYPYGDMVRINTKK